MRNHLVVGATALLLFGLPASADEALTDGIAAQVGSEIVLVSEIMQMVAPMELEMRKAGAPEIEIAKLRAEGLERLIEWRMIEQVVRRAELFATDAQVDQAIVGIASVIGLTSEQLTASVVSQGMTYKDYGGQIMR